MQASLGMIEVNFFTYDHQIITLNLRKKNESIKTYNFYVLYIKLYTYILFYSADIL